MKNNVGANLPKDQTPLPDVTPIPGSSPTQQNTPRISSKERAEVVTDSEGRRFRNGVELFYESEIDSNSNPTGPDRSAPTTGTKNKLPGSASPNLIDRSDDRPIARSTAKQFERLDKAISNADWNLVEKLTSQNPELLTKVQQPLSSLLFEAITNNLPDIAERLIASGASPNYQNSKGKTTLMSASEKGYLTLAEKLIKKGAVVNQKKNDGQTALMLAAKNGHLELVEFLIRSGASVHLKSARHSALTIAAKHGHLEVAALLIRKGLPVNSTQPDGWSALMFAAQMNHLELAEMLIGKGAVVDNEDDNWTALMCAVTNNHLKMVELLIQKKADVNQLRREQWTALILAAKHGYIKIAKLLIQHGAKIDETIKELISPLRMAIKFQKTEIIDLLLPILINKHHKNIKQDFQVELMFAVRNGYAKSLSTLLKHGIKIEPKTDTYIWRAITIAAKKGHTEVIKKLMDEFSPSLPLSTSWINGVDEELFSCLQDSLYEAVKNGHHEIAGLMIKAGAKTDQVNKNKKTLLQFAIEKKHAKIIQLLLEHRPASVQGKSKENFLELLIELHQPSPDSLVVDILLEHQFKVALKDGSYSYNHTFDDLSNYIHTELLTNHDTNSNTEPEQRLMGYLCADLGFRHIVASAVISSARNVLEIYSSMNKKDYIPSAGQLKISFAENLASSQTLNDLMRDDNPAPETIYANHAQAPDLARTLARTTTLQASLLLLTAAEKSQQQQAALTDFLKNLKPGTTALQIQEFMRETGWHPLLVNLLAEAWEDLQQNKTREGLLLAIRRRLDTVEFAEKVESLSSDASRHLLARQAERLSEIIKLLN
jgi:ankyrin repeat protein